MGGGGKIRGERMRGGAEDEASLGYQSAMLLQLLET